MYYSIRNARFHGIGQLNLNSAWHFFERIFLIDMIVEEYSFEVVQFVLQNNREIAGSLDFNILVSEQIVRPDLDAGASDDMAFMVFSNRETSFPGGKICFLDGGGDNFRIDQHEFITHGIAVLSWSSTTIAVIFLGTPTWIALMPTAGRRLSLSAFSSSVESMTY